MFMVYLVPDHVSFPKTPHLHWQREKCCLSRSLSVFFLVKKKKKNLQRLCCSLPFASRRSVCGRVGRETEAGKQRWHQTGSSQRATARPEAMTCSDGDSGDVWERNSRQLAPHQGQLLEPLLLLLLHFPPATHNMFGMCQNHSKVRKACMCT